MQYYPPLPKDKLPRRREDSRETLRRRNRAVIRAEIERYHETLEWIRQFDEATLSGGVHGTDFTRDRVQEQPEYTSTEREAIERARPVITESRRRVEAIGAVLETLDEEKMRFVREKYWEPKYTEPYLAVVLNVSERQMRYWDMQIVCAIGEKLGWEVGNPRRGA